MGSLSDAKVSFKLKIIRLIKELFGEITGTVIGSIGGFIYYRMAGCSTGACVITSNPWLTILWGALLGYLIGSTFRKKQKIYNTMKKNMGLVDRIIRILIAVVVVILYFTNIITGILTIVLLVFSGIFIITGLIGACPLYMPFGISSKMKKV
jgi:LytS/YehU family sensor histidine kinase